jgi:hypothetical protein
MLRRSTLALAVVVLAGSVFAAEDPKPAELKSGPQVGERISGRFEPAWLNGDDPGGNPCPV